LVHGPEPGALTFAKRKHILYPIQRSEIVVCVERCPMADAPDIIKELVHRYESNRDLYRSAAYNEEQTRAEFINPFFEALGWDVTNKAGYSPAYMDVVFEGTVRVEGAANAPDYTFRVGQTRKFFVEAKKPAVSINFDPDHARQIRRYSWTAKLPLGVLTNFHEFAVYDCRIPPKPSHKATHARLVYITYKDYVNRWEEMASILSRDAVWKGSFDRYAESEKGKRGTAEVDQQFLKQIEEWRAVLARNLALRNPQLDVRELNYAVQNTIDRIVFLRMCEDRGIEPPAQLFGTTNGQNIYGRLIDVYLAADAKYNSGLFHFHEEKGRAEVPDTLTTALKIDDKVLADIITGLYYPKSPYEFSVIGADILGSVYEQFLGKVIRLTPAHTAVVDEKPEVKKAGGVYYTPTYIVDYIVKNTVGRLCEGKTPKQVAKLRILDPACGSGSFLINAYAFLLNWHLDYYVKAGPENHKKQVYRISESEWRLTTREKKRILLNNIYGVDIDTQAVEVTKLSLLLKVLEGESRDTLENQLRLFRERALPDLAANIKCGNSLVGTDFDTSGLSDDETKRINPFDWEREFPAIMSKGGFDAVIGNPPWGAEFTVKEQAYLRASYDSGQTGMVDSYALFMECGFRNLRKQGTLGFITPDTFLRKDDHLAVRRLLLQQARVTHLVETGPVFPTVRDTWCAVSILEKSAPDKGALTRHRKINRFIVSADERLDRFARAEWDDETDVPQAIWLDSPQLIIGYHASAEGQTIIRRMEQQPCLGTLTERYAISRGEEGSKTKFGAQADGDFHMVTPAQVERYHIACGSPISSTALTHTKLDAFYKHPKIWVNRIWKMRWKPRLICGLDARQDSAGMKTLQMIVSTAEKVDDLQYLLGILASRLVDFWCVNYLSDDINQSYLERIPVRVVKFDDPEDKARHDKMVELVERMLDLHKKLNAANVPGDKTQMQRRIDATDREIDKLVYQLYGLTDEEIKIVEEVV